MIYSWLKFFHLFAFALWLGPAIGAYWILIRSERSFSDVQKRELEKLFEQVLLFEHAAFISLILTGSGLALQIGHSILDFTWFRLKIVGVLFVVLIEIADVWICHFRFRRSIENDSLWPRFLNLRARFYRIAIPCLLVLIPWIVARAVFH